jgi:hypothetical protein
MNKILMLVSLLTITVGASAQEQDKKKDIQKGESASTKKIKEEQQQATFQIGKTKVEKLNSVDSPAIKAKSKHLIKHRIAKHTIKKSGK